MEHESRLRDEAPRRATIVQSADAADGRSGQIVSLLIRSLMTITLVSSLTALAVAATTTTTTNQTGDKIVAHSLVTVPVSVSNGLSSSVSTSTTSSTAPQAIPSVIGAPENNGNHEPSVRMANHNSWLSSSLSIPTISKFKTEDVLESTPRTAPPMARYATSPPSSSPPQIYRQQRQQATQKPQIQLLTPIQPQAAPLNMVNSNGRILNNYSTVDFHRRHYQPSAPGYQRIDYAVAPPPVAWSLPLGSLVVNNPAPAMHIIKPSVLADNPQNYYYQTDAQARSHDGPVVVNLAPVKEIQQVDRKLARSSRIQQITTILANVLRSAKNILTSVFSSIDQRALSGNLGFGSGLFAAVVPLIALILPDGGAQLGESAGIGSAGGGSTKRNIVGLLGQLVGHSSSSHLLQGRVESMMGWVERSIEHLPNFPRLHPQECVKRSICEAHNEPTKFGAMGIALRLMFPASNLTSTDKMDNMEYKVINKYRHAASFGFTKRLDGENGTSASGSVCKDKYEDCLVSLLEVGQSLVDLFVK